MTKICHITTVHPNFDVRIFYKEAISLVGAGYDVTLIVQHNKNETIDGVKIIALSKPKNRFKRIFSLSKKAYKSALEQKADIYHFHDPELLPWMMRLKAKTGASIIYDVHEDYLTGMRQKRYIPFGIRNFLVLVFNFFEKYCSKNFTKILAEKYYIERFPGGRTVLNYPLLSGREEKKNYYSKNEFRALYTGNISEDRGALIHTSLIKSLSFLHIYMAGKCDKKLLEKLNKLAGPFRDRLHIESGGFIPYKRILEYYNAGNWIAALAVFPFTKHYCRKELTKFFEYMYAGTPVIASNFPAWKEIIEKNQCGICVDPAKPKEAARAIEYLIKNPETAKKMGENGKKAVLEKYNWERESKKLLNIYEELLK